MIFAQIQEIKKQLDATALVQHKGLTPKNVQKTILRDLMKHCTKYTTVTDTENRISILCDIVISCLLTHENITQLHLNNAHREIKDLFHTVATIINTAPDIEGIYYRYDENTINYIINCAIYLIEKLGFNAYECLKEKIKELQTYTGYYSDTQSEFILDEGAYTYDEAYKIASKQLQSHEDIREFNEKDGWFIYKVCNTYEKAPIKEKRLKKWYKAQMIKLSYIH